MMSCVCNVVINEVLTFIQNKCDLMDELSIIQICSSWYSEEEIEIAKSLLCENVKVRKVSRKGEKKNASNLADIIKLLKETEAEKVPNYVAKDLNRLPPVTFDHLDVSSLLKALATMKGEFMLLRNDFENETKRLGEEISQLKRNRSTTINQTVDGGRSPFH